MDECEKCVPRRDPEHTGSPRVQCAGFWVKRFLQSLHGKRSQDSEVGQADPTVTSVLSWQHFLLALLILLALGVMVLILFWNYQCIVVQRLCQAQEERSPFPVFGKTQSSEQSD